MIFYFVLSSLITAFVAVLIYAIVKSVFTFWCYRHVPGPFHFPLIGAGWKFFKPNLPITEVVDVALREIVNEFKENGFVLLFFGTTKLLFLFNSNHATDFLKDNSLITKANEYDYFKAWLGNGLITSSGEMWKKFRKILNPTFHSKILQNYIPAINEQCEKFVNEIRENPNEFVDVRPLMMKLTLNIITVTAMGITLDDGADEISEYRNYLHSVSTRLLARVYNPLFWNDFIYSILPYGRETKRQIKMLHKFTNNVIRKRKRNFEHRDEFGKSKNMAFLDLLLSLQREDETITDKDIREQVDSFLFAGHDTSSVSMAYTLLLLGNDNRIQTKIIEELNSIFGDDKERHVNIDDINKMQYTELVIKESLRLFPPVPFIGRKINSTFEVDGHLMDKGTSVVVSIRDAHRDESVYKEPNKFIPERFQKNTFQATFFPFALGPRNCIGRRFAIIEMKIILSQIFRNFRVTCKQSVDAVKTSADAIARPLTPILINFKRI